MNKTIFFSLLMVSVTGLAFNNAIAADSSLVTTGTHDNRQSVEVDSTITLLESQAKINGAFVDREDFLDFLEATTGNRLEVYANAEQLKKSLLIYQLYIDLSELAKTSGFLESQEAQETLSVLRDFQLADQAQLAGLEPKAVELDALEGREFPELPLSTVSFISKQMGRAFSVDQLKTHPELTQELLQFYEQTKLFADIAKEAGLEKSPDFDQKLKMQQRIYLASAMADQYLLENPITEVEVNHAYEEWASHEDHRSFKVSHILLNDQEEADRILQKIKNNELTFEEGVELYSLDQRSKNIGGKIGGGDWVTFPNKTHPFAKAITEMQSREQLSNVILGVEGNYHIIFLNDIKDNLPAPLEEMRSIIENQVKTQKLNIWYEQIGNSTDIEFL